MNAPSLAVPAFLGQRREFQRQLLARVNENLSELDSQIARQKSRSRLEVEAAGTLDPSASNVPIDDFALELLATKIPRPPQPLLRLPIRGAVIVSLIVPAQDFACGLDLLLSTF
jgi:hypothetical protein